MLQRQGQIEADGSTATRRHRLRPSRPDRGSQVRAESSGRVAEFFREVRSELRQVAWPTRAEVVNSATVVFIALVVLVGSDLLSQLRLLPRRSSWLFTT